MASVNYGNPKDEIEECNGTKAQGQIPLQISVSRRILLSDENPQKKSQDSLLSLSNRMTFLKFGSASAKFRQLAQERDVFSRSVNSSSSHGLRERINGVFERKIDWTLLKKMGKEWIQNPMNMALFDRIDEVCLRKGRLGRGFFALVIYAISILSYYS